MEALKAEMAAGMVNAQEHSVLPLSIYKYSQGAVFEGRWNDITLRCRGVVLDEVGNIVVNGFTKFFNHSEPSGLPGYEARKGMPYTVTEKLDGSLIQAALWNGEVVVTSSGSFDSPQAIQGRYFLEKFGYLGLLEEGKTYLFEIIYPGNRIVLDYGDKEALTLLAIRDTDTGAEHPLDPRFECVQSVSMSLADIEAELVRADYINKEGYIVRFEDGHRVKLKYAEYMRLHKIVAGVNEKFVWEALRDGVNLEASLKGVHDELFKFVQDTTGKIRSAYEDTLKAALAAWDEVRGMPTRKEQAMHTMKNHKNVSSVVFALLDGKEFPPMIWKMLKPEANTVNFGKSE